MTGVDHKTYNCTTDSPIRGLSRCNSSHHSKGYSHCYIIQILKLKLGVVEVGFVASLLVQMCERSLEDAVLVGVDGFATDEKQTENRFIDHYSERTYCRIDVKLLENRSG